MNSLESSSFPSGRGFRARLLGGTLLAGALFFSPAAYAQPDMTRGVYVSTVKNGTTAGAVHFFEVGTDSKTMTVKHRSGTVDTTHWTWIEDMTAAVTSGNIGACAPTGLVQRNMNAVAFGNSLVLAFVGWQGCDKTKGGNLFVISYDLTDLAAYTSDPSKRFGSLIRLGTTNHKGIASSGGSITHDAATAAIVTFDDQLYVFSDSAVYTSGDGVNWSTVPAAAIWGTSVPSGSQPLDAMVYYPPPPSPPPSDGAVSGRILVVFGSGDSTKLFYWNTAVTVSWNGATDGTSSVRVVPFPSPQKGDIEDILAVGLFAGTAAPANAPGFTAGALKPAVQAIVFGSKEVSGYANEYLRRFEFTYDASSEQWTEDPGYALLSDDRTFVWFTDECSSSTSRILRQHILAQYTTNAQGAVAAYSFTSDAMVPKLTGSGYVAPSCGGPDQPEWGGAATDTFAGGTSGDPDSMKTLQGYWNLIGVVQGSPPFAVNGAEPSSWDALSNVAFGTSTSTEVKSTNDQENSFLQSASAKLEIGLRRKDPEKEGSFLEPQLSQSYGHGWLSSKGKTTKSTVGIELEFGTDPAPSDPSALGTSGWAIFTAPTLIAQDFRLYAYDFSISSGSGTSLGQDAHTVSVYETPNLSHGSYVLGAPGGSGDSYPGLLAGVVGHAPSTDLETWGLPDPTDKGYTIVMGDGLHGDTQVPSLSYSSSGGTKVVISSENATLTGSGHTNDVGIEAGLGIKAATRINGLDGSAEGELTAGYEGNFAQTKETTTTTGTDVSVSVSLPPCPATSTDCLSAITVQPFWLQASDDTAPWVPTGRGDLPWFLTWTVTYWRNVDGSTGGHSWTSERASGTVVGGTGGPVTPGSPSSGSFSVAGGKLIWKGPREMPVPIPLTAAKFVPALGASVTIKGYRWASWLQNGTWTRDRKVWTFQSRKTVTSEVVTLRLDFGQLTWDFSIARTDLSPWIKAGESWVPVTLTVNSKYRFTHHLESEARSSWDVKIDEVPGNPNSRWLGGYRGSYDPSNGAGEAVVSGRVPKGRTTFGDLSFSVNGHQVDAPLITHPDYASALEYGRPLVYQRDGLLLTVDFGTKSWIARIDGKAFHERLLPRGGSVKLAAKLGGVVQHQVEVPVKNYTSKLSFRRW